MRAPARSLWARKTGLQALRLVGGRQATENAVSFYESLGFVRVGAIAALRPEPVTGEVCTPSPRPQA